MPIACLRVRPVIKVSRSLTARLLGFSLSAYTAAAAERRPPGTPDGLGREPAPCTRDARCRCAAPRRRHIPDAACQPASVSGPDRTPGIHDPLPKQPSGACVGRQGSRGTRPAQALDVEREHADPEGAFRQLHRTAEPRVDLDKIRPRAAFGVAADHHVQPVDAPRPKCRVRPDTMCSSWARPMRRPPPGSPGAAGRCRTRRIRSHPGRRAPGAAR